MDPGSCVLRVDVLHSKHGFPPEQKSLDVQMSINRLAVA